MKWIKYLVLVAAAAAAGFCTYYFHWSPPSHWMKLNEGETSEWLAWVGLLALLIALVQLVQTESATSSAVKAAISMFMKMTVVNARPVVSQSRNSINDVIANLRSGQYDAAWSRTQAIVDELNVTVSRFPNDAMWEPHLKHLRNALESLANIRDSLQPWTSSVPSSSDVQIIVRSLEQAKGPLHEVEGMLQMIELGATK